MTDPSQPQGLTEVKQYRFVRQLGKGGMGTVFEAIDTRDGGRVAVKLLHPWLVAEDTMFRDRFEREAHIAALLRSPYSVRLLDFGVAGETYFLVMEYVEGATVGKVLEKGPMEPLRALRIAIDVARALEEAAARGVVHRDIKPDNILLTADGRVKVTDFGIARQEGGTGLTSAGRFVGTAEFAAPEQAGGEADHRTDIYALGATLYCMLAGHPPFQSANVWELLKLHQSARVPMEPLTGLPDSICNPVRRCLEKDPRDRYQSASELAGALERAMAGYLHESEAGARTGAGAAPPPSSTPAPGAAPAPASPPVTRVAPEVPGATRVAPPEGTGATRVAAAVPSQPAGGAGLTVEATGRGPGQAMALVAVISNGTPSPLRATLSAAEPTGALAFTFPGPVDVPAGQAVRVPFQARRIRKTPATTVPFQVTAAGPSGARLAFANVTADFARPGAAPGARHRGGSRAPLWIAGGLIVAGGAAAAVLLAGGGGDKDQASPTPGASATAVPAGTASPQAPTARPTSGATTPASPAPTGAAAGIQVLDAWRYAFTITANDCGFGTAAGQQYPLTLRFKPSSGSGTAIKDGDRVNVYAVLDSEVFITAATFRAAGFEFAYNVVGAAGQQGQATIRTTFANETTIANATLTEKYASPACTIAGTHSR
ncbi:MAG: protein kinase [Dehalococcoidia bacterium]|nr:protein kinase [Dehalococcoidia bacterium]